MSDIAEEEVELVEETLQRIASDLSMIADRTFDLNAVKVKRGMARAVGRERVHISFKLGIKTEDGILHGCLLVPLPDAISLACYLMMVPDDGVVAKRADKTLDSTTKDAMLEVGNFIGGAADAAFRALGLSETVKVNSEGCQGVKASVRPALIYNEGDPLLIGRGKAKLHDYQGFEMILMLPDVADLLKEVA
ncbi:MAG: hypothetical protein ACI841_005202 [Planctomycetota bacterium]|jgi:hypothetical protein